MPLIVSPAVTAADKNRFIDIQFALNAHDEVWVPPLRDEVKGLITPGKNPWFEHGQAAFFIASRDGRDVGRISAQIDHLWTSMPAKSGGGATTGNWGMLEADRSETAAALIDRAENWLRAQGMETAVGPVSISIWDEPGLLIEGHEQRPTVMMGHHNPLYQQWVEACSYSRLKDLHTYEVDIHKPFPNLVQRIVRSGARNPRIRIRQVDKRHFGKEAALILSILNDAWSNNWGFVPLTDAEIAYAGKKLKPIIFSELVRVAEVDGEAVAFMMTLAVGARISRNPMAFQKPSDVSGEHAFDHHDGRSQGAVDAPLGEDPGIAFAAPVRPGLPGSRSLRGLPSAKATTSPASRRTKS